MLRRALWMEAIVSLLPGAVVPGAIAAGYGGTGPGGAATKPHGRPVCGIPGHGFASCDANILADGAGQPLVSTSPIPSSYGTAQFHTAYNLPCTPGGAVLRIRSRVAALLNPSRLTIHPEVTVHAFLSRDDLQSSCTDGAWVNVAFTSLMKMKHPIWPTVKPTH
jgi:hypothetical protein